MSLMKNSLIFGGFAFLAYCVYFDRKRRSDPQFKAKLKQKRLIAKREKENYNPVDIPIFEDPRELQAFFLSEIKLAEDEMHIENFDSAIIHFAKAVIVTSQKAEILSCLHRTLPQPLFAEVLKLTQVGSEHYRKKLAKSNPNLVKAILGLASNTNNNTSKTEKKFIDTDIE